MYTEWERGGRYPRPKPPQQGHYRSVPPPAEYGADPGPSIPVARGPSALSYSSGDSFSEEEVDLRRRESRLHDREVSLLEREKQLREQEARLRVEMDVRPRADRSEQMRVQEEVARRRTQEEEAARRRAQGEDARLVIQEGLRREEDARRLERRGKMPERE